MGVQTDDRITFTDDLDGLGDGRVLHGQSRAWHENGQQAAQGRFVRGEREGAWRFWNPSGELDAERSGFSRRAGHAGVLWASRPA